MNEGCMCVCICVRQREREQKRDQKPKWCISCLGHLVGMTFAVFCEFRKATGFLISNIFSFDYFYDCAILSAVSKTVT